jgi:hypothetical protein
MYWLFSTAKKIKLPSALWVGTDFRLIVDDNRALLRHYAVYSDNSLPTFRDNLPVPSSRVKKYGFLLATLKPELEKLAIRDENV